MIKLYRIYFILLLALATMQCASYQLSDKQDDTMDIYLCIGQSNMAGRATIEMEDKDTLKNVFLFKNDENTLWEKAANPLNKYSTIRKKISMQRLSPAYAFAKNMVKIAPNKTIGLIVNAKGGTSIEEWEPGNLLYNQALEQTKKALQNGGTLKGIIWHQGESNSSNYKFYLEKIANLIAALRNDLSSPNLPFVAGQLSPDKPKRKGFNQMLLSLPKQVKNTAVVSSTNTFTLDQTHFDSKSQRVLGERYAKAMQTLLNKK